MSLDRKSELVKIAKVICRDLRKNSTIAEKIFWESIRDRRFDGKKFTRQHPFFHDITGRESFFIADFYCHEERLIIELDGNYHKYRLKEDQERTKIHSYLGLKVIRFNNDEVIKDLSSVLEKVKTCFKSPSLFKRGI